MPIVPRYSEQEHFNGLPDVRQRANTAPFAAAGEVAESAQNLGNTMKREGLAFGELAIKKQEDLDRIQLAKIKAERDANVSTVLTEEERSDDYSSLSDRVNKRITEYDEKLRKSVNGRVRKYVEPMIATENAALVPKLQQMYLKKQDDAASATGMAAIDQFEKNGDYASALGTVDGLPLDEVQKEQLRIGIRNMQETTERQTKVKGLYTNNKGDYFASMKWIDENVPESQQKAFRSEFQSYYSDMDSIKQVTYRKTNEDFAKKYLSRGLSMGDIAGAVKSGALDAADALTWQKRLEADHDRAVAAAARAENQRDREAYKNERLFSLSLRHMTPIQQQYAEFAHYYGVTPAMVNKNYNDAMKKADAGKLTFDDVAALQANGLVIPIQAEQLNGRLQGQASVAGKKYDAAMARGRSYLDKLLGKANISNSLIQDALANYDDLAIGGNLDPKEFTNVALNVAYSTLYSKDVQKTERSLTSPLKGFKVSTPAGDVFNEVAALRKNEKKLPSAPKPASAKGALDNSGGQKSRKDELNDILFK